ncbi:MAG: peptidase dimerization domain-containing protein, partial [Myxococcota bacterium]
AVNIVPDHCSLEFGFRPLPGQPRDEVATRLRRRLDASQGPWTFELERQHGIAALHTQPNTPLEQLLRPHSLPSESDAASFATDGGNLAALGMNPVVFGPGSIEVAHRADEYVEVRALHQASAVLEQIITARCVV